MSICSPADLTARCIAGIRTISRRVWEHQQKTYKGFTAKYGVNRLVWYEFGETREGAFTRERQIKKWNRAWKIRLIEALNPTWSDLSETLNC